MNPYKVSSHIRSANIYSAIRHYSARTDQEEFVDTDGTILTRTTTTQGETPATISLLKNADSMVCYWKGDRLHRLGGPAIEITERHGFKRDEYWIDGLWYTAEDFLLATSKLGKVL